MLACRVIHPPTCTRRFFLPRRALLSKVGSGQWAVGRRRTADSRRQTADGRRQKCRRQTADGRRQARKRRAWKKRRDPTVVTDAIGSDRGFFVRSGTG